MIMTKLRDVLEYRLPYLVISIDLPFTLNDDVVVDIETTGLDYVSDWIISYGYVVRDKANVITLAFGDIGKFSTFCRGLTKLLKKSGFRLWAWYKDFEEEFLGVKFNELQLRPYEKEEAALSFGFDPPAKGEDVPKLWREWCKYGDVKALRKIALRNLYDIVIEAASLARHKLYRVINGAD